MIQIVRCKRCRPTDLVELTEKCQKKGEKRQKHVMWLIPSQVAIEKVSKKRRKATKTCHHQIGRPLAEMQLLGHGHKKRQGASTDLAFRLEFPSVQKSQKVSPVLHLSTMVQKWQSQL
jgi:hypothetical protein